MATCKSYQFYLQLQSSQSSIPLSSAIAVQNVSGFQSFIGHHNYPHAQSQAQFHMLSIDLCIMSCRHDASKLPTTTITFSN
jgi:hypothetical protein